MSNFTKFLCGSLMLISISVFAAKDTVSIVDGNFIPSTLTINEGDTVYWMQNGTMVHTTTSGNGCNADGIWDSGNLNPGDVFDRTFNSAGSYPYFCIPHCSAGMTGEIIVQSIVGTREIAVPDFKIFPVPANDHLIVEQVSESAEVEVFSLDGRYLNTQSSYNDGKFIISTSDLSPGIYLLRISDDSRMAVRRFSKN